VSFLNWKNKNSGPKKFDIDFANKKNLLLYNNSLFNFSLINLGSSQQFFTPKSNTNNHLNKNKNFDVLKSHNAQNTRDMKLINMAKNRIMSQSKIGAGFILKKAVQLASQFKVNFR